MSVKYDLACVLACIIMSLFVFAGCSDSTSTEEPKPNQAEQIFRAANDSLGSQMNEMINETLDNADSSFRPRDIDFSGVNQMYEQALASDPSHLGAAFGSSMTGLLMFLADDDFNALYDRFKNFIDTSEFFSPTMIPVPCLGGPLAPELIPLTPGGFMGVLPDLTRLDRVACNAALNGPDISELQDNLRTRLLPLVLSARTRMLQVLADPQFTFEITPEMQGNSGASPIVIDRADCEVMLAVLYAAEAALKVFFARNLDFDSYTLEGVEEALRQGSDFLSLKVDGASLMSDARARILDAEEALETAIDYLIAELSSDPDQTDDLIKVYPDDEQDLRDLQDSLDHYAGYFDGPTDLHIEFGGFPANDTLTLSVDIAKFFDAPMGNPKDFMPDYILELDDLGDGWWSYCFTWDAVTYLDWTWPHPTFNGLLPGMTSTEIKRILVDYDLYEWERISCGTEH